MSGVGISLILAVILLIAAICFGAWAFTSRQDYKNNTDQKIATAVTVAKQEESSAKDKEFVEKEKNPVRTYSGPQAYGSLIVHYPKTWSGIVDDTGKNSGALVNGYFYPNIVPSISDPNSSFALRIQVLNQSYAEVAKNYTELQQDKNKPVTITPYALPKLPKVVGMQLSGNLPNQKTGVMVVLPLRFETLLIWTEGSQFTGDFTNTILPQFSFSP